MLRLEHARRDTIRATNWPGAPRIARPRSSGVRLCPSVPTNCVCAQPHALVRSGRIAALGLLIARFGSFTDGVGGMSVPSPSFRTRSVIQGRSWFVVRLADAGVYRQGRSA